MAMDISQYSRRSMGHERKARAPRNRTLTLGESERMRLAATLLRPPLPVEPADLAGRVACGDSLAALGSLPRGFVDLLILDPPYNLSKDFGGASFRRMSLGDYEEWFEDWFVGMLPLLKPTASLYVCGDWRSSSAVQRVLERRTIVRNRITWESSTTARSSAPGSDVRPIRDRRRTRARRRTGKTPARTSGSRRFPTTTTSMSRR